jgi:hypothetical protein
MTAVNQREETMRALLGVSASVLVFIAFSALAGPKEDALAIDQRWTKAFDSGDAAAIVALYDADARLHPTVSATRMDGRDAILGYFNRVFSAFPTRSVTFKNEAIREVGSGVIVNSGFYDLGSGLVVRATYSSKRPVASRSRSYRLVSGNGGNQDSRRTIQSS